MQNLICKTLCIIKVPSEVKAKAAVMYDEPPAIFSIRSEKLCRNWSLIVCDLIEKIWSVPQEKADKPFQRSKCHILES